MLAAWQSSSSSMVVVEESRGVLRHSSSSSMLVGAAAREGHAGALLHHSGQMHRLLGCTLLCCLLFNQDHITSHFASHHTDAVQHFVPYAAHYLGIPCCTFFKSSCSFFFAHFANWAASCAFLHIILHLKPDKWLIEYLHQGVHHLTGEARYLQNLHENVQTPCWTTCCMNAHLFAKKLRFRN